ncbi:MAG: ASKHA domain-containing protein [Thermodesulfovibrionales bacterium]
MNHSPLVFLRSIRLSPPSSADKTADADRLIAALKQEGFDRVVIPLDILRRLPGELRKNGFELDLVLGVEGETVSVIDISRKRLYGLALDIGSTNIECALFDLSTGDELLGWKIGNPQVPFGSDVLTRVQGSMMGRFDLLAGELLEGINRLIREVCSLNGIAYDEIVVVTVAGNTIMTHFFLGLDVNNIPLSPYIPVVSSAVFLRGAESGLMTNRNSVVYVFPNAGSYVGGDIISGIIAAGVAQEEAPVLFVDVGTNVEVTLGCRDWIMTGAGAAGPALEGGIAGIGKTAEPGTIYKVRIDRSTGRLQTEVLAGTEPQGICGSGLIDLVAALYDSGQIDQAGRFTVAASGVVERDGVKAFTVYRSGEVELMLTEPEIRNFLISKAAMFSFLHVFVRSVGLTFRDIKKIYIAGALGCGIDPESAIRIGMLPDVPRERFIPLGNSSLAGAGMVLMNADLLAEVDRISRMVTYREMNEDAELMNILQGAMFIPHTDPELLKG